VELAFAFCVLTVPGCAAGPASAVVVSSELQATRLAESVSAETAAKIPIRTMFMSPSKSFETSNRARYRPSRSASKRSRRAG
jgi:hypothetical protein